jgi:hypothetical protein
MEAFMEYVKTQVRPDRIEEGHFEVRDNQLRVVLTAACGGHVLTGWLAEGEDPKRAAQRLMRENYAEHDQFWGPLDYPKKGWL